MFYELPIVTWKTLLYMFRTEIYRKASQRLWSQWFFSGCPACHFFIIFHYFPFFLKVHHFFLFFLEKTNDFSFLVFFLITSREHYPNCIILLLKNKEIEKKYISFHFSASFSIRFCNILWDYYIIWKNSSIENCMRCDRSLVWTCVLFCNAKWHIKSFILSPQAHNGLFWVVFFVKSNHPF